MGVTYLVRLVGTVLCELNDDWAIVRRSMTIAPREEVIETPAPKAQTIHNGPEMATIHLPTALRKYCGGAADLPVSATTVRAALEELERSHPSLHRNICDETGAVRRHLNVFVNVDHMRDRQGLDTALAPRDVVTILAAVSGG